MSSHAADLWGILLLTVGVLTALAIYGSPWARSATATRVATGDVLGWGRFLVPPVAIVTGVLLIAGRRDPRDPAAEPRREPIRAVLGGILILLAVAGLAALAGGAPEDRVEHGLAGRRRRLAGCRWRAIRSAPGLGGWGRPPSWWRCWWWPWCC